MKSRLRRMLVTILIAELVVLAVIVGGIGVGHLLEAHNASPPSQSP